MQKTRVIKMLLLILLTLAFSSCRHSGVPRPRGYFRIDLPRKDYISYDTTCPFTFEYPSYSIISYDTGNKNEPCWFNIVFPHYHAKIYISYLRINRNLDAVLQESHEFAYSHTVKADAITEQPWINPAKKVYGILYDIKGNTASAVQFFLTDSTKNFIRGALYFDATPEEDSLAPVIKYFREDIIHLIETLKWKDTK